MRDKELFFDTDCLSSFLWINDTNILQTLYGGRIVIPEPVFQELLNPCVPHIGKRTKILIETNIASLWKMEIDKEEYKLYRSLIGGSIKDKAIGKGEAASIALARTYHGILASNNWKDIVPYIKKYNLKHIDTGHILLEAFKKEIITECEGERIWQQMLDKNRNLPDKTFRAYLEKEGAK